MFTKSSTKLVEIYKKLNDLEFDFRNKNLINLILEQLEGASLLDVGCGVGHLLNLASIKGLRTYGIEPDKELIKLNKTVYSNKNVKIFNKKAEQLNEINLQVDNVTLIDVLEHIKDDDLILRDIKKNLKKNGKLIIVVPAYEFLYGKRDVKIHHYRRYSQKALLQKLKNAGFKIEKKRYWNVVAVIPYMISEKILKRELEVSFRYKKNKKMFSKILNRLLQYWFCYIENNISFGFGLSLVVVATLKTHEENHK